MLCILHRGGGDKSLRGPGPRPILGGAGTRLLLNRVWITGVWMGMTRREFTWSSEELQVVHRVTGRPQTYKVVHRLTRSSTDLQGRTQTYKVVHEPQVSCTFLRAVRRSPHFLSAPSTCIVPYPFLFLFSRKKLLTTPYSIPLPKVPKCVF